MRVCGSNASMKRCDSGVRIVGVGLESTSNLTQTKANTIELIVGGSTVILRKRTRNFTLEHYTKSTITGSYICQSTFDSGWFHGMDSQTSAGNVLLEEDYVTIDASIIYMDLRQNAVLCEEETDTMKFKGAPADSVLFINNSGLPDSRQIVVIPADTPYKAVETNTVNAEPYESKTTPYGLDWAADLHIPMPWSGGSPKYDSNIDYLLYSDATVQEFGGHDFYHPRWIQPVGVDHGEDDFEKAAHLALIGEMLDGERIDPGYRGFTPTTLPKGSLAFDRYGNKFYSYKNVLGKGTAKLSIQGVDTYIPRDAEADAWYPVSPI